MDKFKVQGYFDFLSNTKPGSMLVKDVLEERNILLVHANSGTSKTSAWGYDLAAALISGKSFLDKFEVLAKNVYVFFVSQDAPAHDVVRHSQKVFRHFFDLKDPAVRANLNNRFNVLDYEAIKFGKGSLHAQRLVDSIRDRLAEVRPQVPAFPDISDAQVTEAERRLKEDWLDLPSVQPDEEPVEEPKVLILWDSLRKLHDGKESASDELKPVIDSLRHVDKALDATSVLFHHNNRSGTMRGDASIEDAVDQSYHIKRRRGCKATSEVQTFELHIEKPRGIAVQPFIYQMVRDGAHTKDEVIRFSYVREMADTEAVGDPDRQQTARKRNLVPKVDQKLEDAGRVWAEGMSARELAKRINVGRKKAKVLIEDLRAGRSLRAG